ncbi:MAG: hypothetical protein QOH67_1537, partial [Hyphomicrobiales bacterium]|nr:hypothetical protein [Hyphomicrobiales bacterium]
NAAIDLVFPAPGKKAEVAVATPAEAAGPVAYALASTTSTPVDIAPVKVKTIPMLFRESEAEQPPATERLAAVPLPRPRPASAPALAMAPSDGLSLAQQPGSMAISAATRKGAPDDGEVLGSAGIERMKMALALTAEQEEYWPAIAAELQALGKTLKTHKGRDGKINVDNDTIQRLYWAAAPLITRLSYEQKQKVKQMAHVMGLRQVAEAL